MNLKFDLDPTPRRAATICACIFILTFTTAVAAISVTGDMPTMPQFITILCGAFSAAVTYILGFLGYEHKKDGENNGY